MTYSWRQSLDHPVLRLPQAVHEAVVQSVLAALPELDHHRDDAIPAPMRRARDRPVLVRGLELVKVRVEIAASDDDATLLGSPRAELTPAPPRSPVRFRLFDRGLHDRAFGAHLTIEERPEPAHRCQRILVELRSL